MKSTIFPTSRRIIFKAKDGGKSIQQPLDAKLYNHFT